MKSDTFSIALSIIDVYSTEKSFATQYAKDMHIINHIICFILPPVHCYILHPEDRTPPANLLHCIAGIQSTACHQHIQSCVSERIIRSRNRPSESAGS